jgi:putative heme iron utilization protein
MITDNAKTATARDARHLLRAHRYGVLSTLSKKFDGHPFGSITPYLVDHDGSLLILISTLAEHTKNILNDSRVSLITHNQESTNIQTQGRVTVLGMASLETNREIIGKRYLRYFPEAQPYFAMHDFSFYRIVPQAIRFIGGFGNIQWVKAADYVFANYPLIAPEEDFLAQINSQHEAAIRRHTGQENLKSELIGIDIDGFDIRVGERIMRIQSEVPILDLHQALLALTQNILKSRHSRAGGNPAN